MKKSLPILPRILSLCLALTLCGSMLTALTACGDKTPHEPPKKETSTDVPDVPDEPDEPVAPTETDVPDVPDEPDEPVAPTETDVPDVPDEPLAPTETDIPDVPDVPDVPDTPDVPTATDDPAVPGEVTETDVPEDPAEPTGTDIPEEPTTRTLSFVGDATVFATQTAIDLLSFCNTVVPEGFAYSFAKYGFEVLAQNHFDKAAGDTSHTSAYTLGHGTVTVAGEERDAYLLAVRYTHEGEWASNFDIQPSRNYENVYAENFYLTAMDVWDGVKDLIDTSNDPVIIVTGHSRGAATANLLGLLMNRAAIVSTSDLYVYTFATPRTLKPAAVTDCDCPNVFNIINPADLVTELPLSSWGFGRVGQDVLLPADETVVASLSDLLVLMQTLCPDVASYYTKQIKISNYLSYSYTTHEIIQKISSVLFQNSSAPHGQLNAFSIDSLLDFSNIESSIYLISWYLDSDSIKPLVAYLLNAYETKIYLQVAVQHEPSTYHDLLTSVLN